MAISFYHEFPDMSPQQSAQVLDKLGVKSTPPSGQIFHAEGPMESGGTWVMDCWESPEALQTFVEQKLMPAMQSVGVTPPQPNILQTRAVLSPQGLREF